jgi:hypothetical protein
MKFQNRKNNFFSNMKNEELFGLLFEGWRMRRPTSAADDKGVADTNKHRPWDPLFWRAQRQLRGRRDWSGETFILGLGWNEQPAR